MENNKLIFQLQNNNVIEFDAFDESGTNELFRKLQTQLNDALSA